MRMFIAIDIGEREEIVDMEKKLEKIEGKIKLVEPWNVHLTLKFLGETKEEIIPEIKKVMEKSVEDISPFSCNLTFTPHITIARVKNVKEKKEMKSFLQEYANASFGVLNVNSIVLKKSELRKEGPIYETIEEVKL
ncbi:hypothetical protein B6U81_04450 [Thermoplasmatales archaeon ex4484_30]|nr:MAG: hypothetical protein B6U81_04450 [Thermoplasmatales archaeon ex4484_30]